MTNYFSNNLSYGQLAVMDHSLSFIHEWDKSILKRSFCVEELKRKCCNDLRITNDTLLSQSLNKNRFSRNFLDLLSRESRVTDFYGKMELNEPFQFIYNRADSPDERLYFGGKKYVSTYSCIMGLTYGTELDNYSWNLFYYENESILTVSEGGNHRTLAHLMLGNYSFTPQRYFICKTKTSSETINQIN